MPVGRVFNAAENQVLFSPVSNYYQGKAIRQQLAAGEQDAKLKDLQMKGLEQELADAPARKEAANKKAAADYALVLESIRAKKLANGAAEMDAARDIVGPWVAEYDKRGIEWANENFEPLVLSRLPESKRVEFEEARGEDRSWNEDEMARVGFMIAVNEVDNDPDPTSHQKHLQSLVDQDFITQERANELIEAIEVKAGTVTGTTERDPGQFPGTASQRGTQYLANIEEYNISSDVQELITSALPEVYELPDAVGAKGAFGVAGAGVLTNLGQDEMADAFSQWMSGADPIEATQLQLQLQVLRGRIIPIVTGEQGKRLSETEREIASTVVGLIEQIKGPADLTKSYPRVVGAMRQLYAESWVRKFNIASRDEDIPPPYDLANKEQRIELFTEFSDAGVDMNTAKRTMIRLKLIQGVE